MSKLAQKQRHKTSQSTAGTGGLNLFKGLSKPAIAVQRKQSDVMIETYQSSRAPDEDPMDRSIPAVSSQDAES